MKNQQSVMVVLLGLALIWWGCATPLKQAERLEKVGNYQDAIAAYEQVAQADPNSSEARKALLKIALIYRDHLKQPDEALARFRQVAEQFPGTDEGVEALYQVGVQLMQQEKYEEAAQVFQEVVNKYPERRQSQYAQLLMARAYEQAGKSEEASEVYAAFARRTTDSRRALQALLNKARLDRKIGKQESATQALQEAVRKYANDPEAKEELEKVKAELREMGARIPEAPKVDTQLQRRAERREQRRERDRPRSSFYGREQTRTQAQYTNSFNVNPEDLIRDMQITVDEQGTLYDAMMMIANSFFSMEDYNSAGALYERAIQMATNAGARVDPQNYRKLAQCYAKVGLKAKAEETLRMAAKRDPAVIDTIIEAGDFEYQSGNYEKAIETYQSALGYLPAKNADIYYHMGLAYKKLGDVEKELESFERAVALRPTDKDAMQSLAEVLAYRAGNRPRAEIYQDLVDGRTSTYEMQMELADLCFRYKNYQWARTKYTSAARTAQRKLSKTQDAEEAAKLKRQILTAQVMAEVANAYRGKLEEAKAAFEKLVAEQPDSPAAHLGQGYFALLEGDPDRAVAEFRAALEKDPAYRQAALALGRYYLSVGKDQQTLEVWKEYLKHNRADRDLWMRSRRLEKKLQAEAQAAQQEAAGEANKSQGESGTAPAAP